MPEEILDSGCVQQEHAPLIRRADPMPPGKIAIWLFLASEIMFFIGLLGSYIVLRAGAPLMFTRHAMALNKSLAGGNTIVLLLSSGMMYVAVDSARKLKRSRLIASLAATILLGAGFLGIKSIEYADKFRHHTIVPVTIAGQPQYVYDGHVRMDSGKRILSGYRAETASIYAFDINAVSEEDVKRAAAEAAGKTTEAEIAALQQSEFDVPPADATAADISYGPWKNIFYASYFTLTGAHAVHLIGGLVALLLLLAQAIRGRILPAHTQYVAIYWYFVDLVWLFLFPMLYLS